MFEVVISIGLVWLILVMNVFWVKVLLLVAVFLLVFSGLYSMFAGAPYIPTSRKRITAMMKLAKFSGKDRVYDLGCGDGRVIFAVAKRGVRKAIGYEYSLPTFIWAFVRGKVLRSEARVVFANFWKKDMSEADVVVCFLLERTMGRIKEEVWSQLKPGARMISNEFVLPGVDADREMDGVYLYVKK